MTELVHDAQELEQDLDFLIPDFASQLGDVQEDMDIGEPFEKMLDSSVGLAYDTQDESYNKNLDQISSAGTTDTDMEMEEDATMVDAITNGNPTPLEDKASKAFTNLMSDKNYKSDDTPKDEAKSLWLMCCAGRSPKNVIKKKPAPNCLGYGEGST